jgi:hypothetical protein
LCGASIVLIAANNAHGSEGCTGFNDPAFYYAQTIDAGRADDRGPSPVSGWTFAKGDTITGAVSGVATIHLKLKDHEVTSRANYFSYIIPETGSYDFSTVVFNNSHARVQFSVSCLPSE